MDVESTEGTESSLTTGEDIGKITWPRVAAEPGHVQGEYEGVGPHSYHNEPAPQVPNGTYDVTSADRPGSLEVEFVADGMATLHYQAGDSVFAAGGRLLRLSAAVRQSWVTETARGSATRGEQGLRIARALVGLASLPGQRTVAIEESGLTVHESLASLSSVHTFA